MVPISPTSYGRGAGVGRGRGVGVGHESTRMQRRCIRESPAFAKAPASQGFGTRADCCSLAVTLRARVNRRLNPSLGQCLGFALRQRRGLIR